MREESGRDKPAVRFSRAADARRLTRPADPAQRPRVSSPRPASARPAPLLAAVLIVAGVLLAYHNSYDAPFVFDDVSAIVENPTLGSLRAAWSPPAGGSLTVEGRPLLNVSFALNRLLTGPGPAGFRAVNVAFHAAAALVLYGLVRRTFAGPGRPERSRAAAGAVGLVTALAWALHPLQTESVTYVVQRAESLMGLLYLISLYAFARGAAAARGGGWLALSVAAVLAGGGVKEVAATAPGLILLYDRTFVAGGFAAAWRARRAYYLALAATWLPLAWQVAATGGNRSGIMGFDVGVGWWAYVAAQAEAVVRYLGLSLWPAPLVFEYGLFRPRPWPELLPWLALALPLLAGAGLALWRRPVAGFAGAAFFLLLAPTSLVPSTTQLIVEHRMYLPLAAVVALVAGTVLPPLLAGGRGRLAWSGAALGLAALLTLTLARNRTYASELALWRDTIVKRPDNALAHHVLAEALKKSGAPDEALRYYARAVELRPEFVLPRGGQARLLAQAGRFAEARAAADAALARAPDHGPAHELLAQLAAREGRAAEAIAHWQQAAAGAPNDARLRYELAGALARAGRGPDAETVYLALIAAEPGQTRARFYLAELWRRAGRATEAIAQYREIVRLQPDHYVAHNNLATALAAAGELEAAVAHYQAARRDPAAPAEVHHNLGVTLLRLGRRAEAEQAFVAALRTRPDFAPARAALEELREAALGWD